MPHWLSPSLPRSHPIYMPEGTEGKLGDFPCYDPAKVRPRQPAHLLCYHSLSPRCDPLCCGAVL